MKSLHCKRACLFRCITHAALKRVNGIDPITEVIVFLAVKNDYDFVSLCVIADYDYDFIVCDRRLRTIDHNFIRERSNIIWRLGRGVSQTVRVPSYGGVGWPNHHIITFILAKKSFIYSLFCSIYGICGERGWLKTSYGGGVAENVKIPSYGGGV